MSGKSKNARRTESRRKSQRIRLRRSRRDSFLEIDKALTVERLEWIAFVEESLVLEMVIFGHTGGYDCDYDEMA